MKADGSFPTGRMQVAPIVATTMRSAGATNNAIQGVLYNVMRESNFNPTSREEDQPNWGGEARYAHGLYQEGAQNWNRYRNWLGGKDWRDPHLQTKFLTDNLKRNYSQLWQAMNQSKTPEEAAALFVRYYLRPSAPNMRARLNAIWNGDVRRAPLPATAGSP
jgi:hypothetical protein